MKVVLLLVVMLLHLAEIYQAFKLKNLIYDTNYIRSKLDSRYSYLKLPDGDYIGPRDYFNFTQLFKPTREYLENKNLEGVLYEELRGMELMAAIATMDQWNYSNSDEEVSKEANEELCNRQIIYIESQLASANLNGSGYLFEPGLKNQQFLRYIDSWARPPSEVYHGHSYWTGSYSGCMSSRLEYENATEMTFNYCWAKLRPKSWPLREEMLPRTSFRAGICLPRSCDTRWANRNKRRILNILKFNFSPLHQDRFTRLIHVYCLPDRLNKPLPVETKLFLWATFTWIAFVVAATLFGKSSGKFYHLSITKSWNTFNEDNQPVDSQNNRLRVDLRSIGVVRFVACLGVCMGHCLLAYGWVSNSSSIALVEFSRIRYIVLSSLMKSLDVHIVIAGIMTSYSIIGKFAGRKIDTILRPKMFMLINLTRFLRLAPMLIITICFMKSLYGHLSEGPMWDYGTSEHSLYGPCLRSSWWRALVVPILFGYKGNPYSSECLAVSWYSIVDIKLAFLGTIIVYVLQRQHSKGWQRKFLLLVIVFASFLSQYIGLSWQRLVYFKQFFTYGQPWSVNILHLKFQESTYFSALNRLHTFACGLWAGHYLQQYKTGRIQRWPFWMRGWWLKLIVLYQFYAIASSCYAMSNFNKYGVTPSEEAIKLSIVLGPRLDAFIIALLVTRFASDLSASLMRNTLPLYKLSKLSYCVFLIHSIVISYMVSATEHSRFSMYSIQLVVLATFTVTASFLISLPLHLLFELPLAELCVKGPLASFRNKASLDEAVASQHSKHN